MRKKLKRLIWIAPAAIVGMAVFIAIGGQVVMLLWNWLLPELFGWQQITFWQALALLALCRILFGGFGVHGGRSRRRCGDRWEQMSPEEREKIRDAFHKRWGEEPPPDTKPTA